MFPPIEAQLEEAVIDWSRAPQEAVSSRANNRFLTGAAPTTHNLEARLA